MQKAKFEHQKPPGAEMPPAATNGAPKCSWWVIFDSKMRSQVFTFTLQLVAAIPGAVGKRITWSAPHSTITSRRAGTRSDHYGRYPRVAKASLHRSLSDRPMRMRPKHHIDLLLAATMGPWPPRSRATPGGGRRPWSRSLVRPLRLKRSP